jgi:hypothetical protein
MTLAPGSSLRSSPFRGFVVVALFAMSACNCGGPVTKCISDAECDVTKDGGRKCELSTGTCICANNKGCTAPETCNAAGRCQAQGGCLTNDDCGTNGNANAQLFCDITTSECLAVDDCNPQQGQHCCVLDDECPFRQICDAVSRSCVPGCRDDGDCLIGEGCSGASFGHLGSCGTACTADDQCPPAFLCNIAVGKCEGDTRGPYCLSCTGGVESTQCGDPANYCLLDETDPTAQAEFCGVDCSAGQACPNDYDCQQVIILPPNLPTCSIEKCNIATGATSGVCSSTGGPCTQDKDCTDGPPWGTCVEPGPAGVGHHGTCADDGSLVCTTDTDCPTGKCTIVSCVGSEQAKFGTCTCTRDADCPTDTCSGADQTDPQHPVFGHCQLSGHKCLENVECDVITCVNGGCLIGSNCAPSDNRSCADLASLTTPTTQGQ